MEEESIVDEWGTKIWYNGKGELHREDGPAILYIDGEFTWYKNGMMHREDGPAFCLFKKYAWMINNIEVDKEDVLDTPEKRRNWEIEETIRKL